MKYFLPKYRDVILNIINVFLVYRNICILIYTQNHSHGNHIVLCSVV